MAESTTLSAKTLTRRNAKDKTVLAILPMGNGMAQAALSGIRAEAAVRRWHVMSAETERASDGSLRVERSSGSIASVGELAALMRPDGVIVWGYALSPDEVAANVGTVPSVFIDPPFNIRPSRRKFAVVRGDARAVASLAARELLFRDFTDLAFVPSSEREVWSHERGEAFRDCARVAGTRYHEFEFKESAGGSRAETLRRWLVALPKPCGLFAANDKAGEEVLGACAALGIAAPQDVSVVGVDNMAYLCESTSPTLSSILMDHSGEGRAAAQLLDGLMEAPNRKTPPPRAASDRWVAKALEFIRLGACEEGFSPRDVVANMGVSRSLAFDLFRRVAGHTILDEILHVRLDKAFTLLADTDTAIGAIYAHCGFRSPRALDFLVHDRTGMSMREWRRRNARK